MEDQEADYIGKEALMRIKAEGVKRKLVGIEIEGEPWVIEPVEPLFAYRNGKPVDRVTVVIWSSRLEKNIGYVWVPIDLAEPGTVLDVETPRGRVKARIASLPFLDPNKAVPKS